MVDDSMEFRSECMNLFDTDRDFEPRDDLAESFDDRSLSGLDEVRGCHALDHAEYLEVVAEDAGVEIADVDPLMATHDNESVTGHADQRLADGYATYPELDRECVDIDAIPWPQFSVEDPFTKNLGHRLGRCLTSESGSRGRRPSGDVVGPGIRTGARIGWHCTQYI